MVIVPSQELKGGLIRGGITKIKIRKDICFFIYPQIKSAHLGYRNQGIGIMSI